MIHAGCYSAHAAFPQGGVGHGCRRGEEETASRSSTRMKAMPVEDDCLRPEQDPRGRPQAAHLLPVRGEEAVGEQGSVGLLQGAPGDAAGRGLAPARRGQVLLREEPDAAVTAILLAGAPDMIMIFGKPLVTAVSASSCSA